MKIKFKLLIVLVATFCMTLVCGIITACTEQENLGDPAVDGYVITVKYPDGSIVKGSDAEFRLDVISVELVDADGKRISDAAYAEINESGIAQINYFTPGEYYIQVNDYPTGYVFEKVKTSANQAYYTVSLQLDAPTPYKVNVKYFDGTAVDDVVVKLMNGTETVSTAITNGEGAATTGTIERGAYSVQLANLPKGYTYKPVSTTIAASPLSVTILRITDITFENDDKLNDETVKPWDEALNSYDNLSMLRFNKDGDCYQYIAELGEREEVFYKIHAPKTGEYTIASKEGNDYIIQFYTDDLTYIDSSLTISSKTNNGNNVQKMRIEENQTLTFSVKSTKRQACNVEIMVCMPVPAPISTTAISPDVYTLTFQNYNTAILRFVTSNNPKEGFGQGVYKFTSLSETYDVMIVEYANSFPALDENSDLTGDYEGYAGNDNGANDGKNFVFERELQQGYVGVTLEYHVIIKDALIDYPVQIDVQIIRMGDAIEPNVERKTATTDVSEKYADQQGTFTWMPTDGSLETVRHEDGKWYVKLKDGTEKPLLIAITKNLSGMHFSFATIEYFGEKNGESEEPSAERQNNNLTVYEDLTTLDTTWNYTGFIEKYAGYTEHTDDGDIYHEGYVNSDGVYQVNDELKLFLERYMNQRFHDITGSTEKPLNPWLLGCGYYADDAEA